MEATQKSENFMREILFILFSQKRIILSTAVLIFTVTLLIAFLWPPTYEARGSFLVKGKRLDRNPEALESTVLRVDPVTREDLFSEVQILRSEEVLRGTVEALRKVDTVFELPDKNDDVAHSSAMLKWIADIRSHLETEVVATTKVIEVRMTWGDSAMARTILDTLMKVYLAKREEIFHPDQEKRFFNAQVEGYLEDLGNKQRQLEALVRSEAVSDPDKEIESNLQLAKTMGEETHRLEQAIVETELMVRNLQRAQDQPGAKTFSFVDNLAIQSLGNKLQDLLMEQTGINKVFKPESAESRAIARQVADAYAILKREVDIYQKGLESKAYVYHRELKRIREQLDGIRARNIQLKMFQIQERQISRDERLLQSSFETFFKRREETARYGEESNELLSSYIFILSQAKANPLPVFPRKKILVPFGLFVALLTGTVLGFFNEFLDHTFKRAQDVPRLAGLPLILSLSEEEGMAALGGGGEPPMGGKIKAGVAKGLSMVPKIPQGARQKTPIAEDRVEDRPENKPGPGVRWGGFPWPSAPALLALLPIGLWVGASLERGEVIMPQGAKELSELPLITREATASTQINQPMPAPAPNVFFAGMNPQVSERLLTACVELVARSLDGEAGRQAMPGSGLIPVPGEGPPAAEETLEPPPVAQVPQEIPLHEDPPAVQRHYRLPSDPPEAPPVAPADAAQPVRQQQPLGVAWGTMQPIPQRPVERAKAPPAQVAEPAASAPDEGFFVQLASFTQDAAASQFKSAAQGKGFGAHVRAAGGSFPYKVILGPFPALPQAKEALSLWKQMTGRDGFVIKAG